MTNDLFPKPPRRMRQPAKCVLREQLVLAAEELIAQRERTEEAVAAAQAVAGELPKPVQPRITVTLGEPPSREMLEEIAEELHRQMYPPKPASPSPPPIRVERYEPPHARLVGRLVAWLRRRFWGRA